VLYSLRVSDWPLKRGEIVDLKGGPAGTIRAFHGTAHLASRRPMASPGSPEAPTRLKRLVEREREPVGA